MNSHLGRGAALRPLLVFLLGQPYIQFDTPLYLFFVYFHSNVKQCLTRLLPLCRTAPLGNHMSVDEWTQGTESQQLVSAKAQSKTRVGKQTKGTKSQQIEAAEVPKHLYNDDQTEGTESQGIRLADFHKKMASLSKSNIAQAEVLKPLRTLRFEVCNSYTNQRLALVFGILLANVTSRTPVLPHFLFNVDQFSGDDVTTAEDTVLMEEVYDTDGFLEGVLRRTGVRILLPTEAPKSSEYAPFSIAGDWRHWLDRLVQVEAPHVALDCTFLKLGKDAIREREGLVWAVLDSLNLNVRFASMRDAAARLTEQTRAGTRVRRVRQRGPAAAGESLLGCIWCVDIVLSWFLLFRPEMSKRAVEHTCKG